MSIETGLTTLLLAQSAITSLVPAQTIGGTVKPAIVNEEPEQGMKPPFIVIVKKGHDPMGHLDGTYGTRATTFDVDCYHFGNVGAKAISDAVETFLNDYAGAAGSGDTIKAVNLTGSSYRKLFNADGTDTRQRISTVTYLIHHVAV